MSNFSQWLWLMIWWFFIVVYLIILFQIIGDMFRDHALNGWAKAAWIIGLIFLPFLVALIYIIARGHGMAERQVKAVQTAQANTDTYIRSVAGSGKSPAEQITDAKALLDSGTISQAEFDALKAKALA